MALNIGCSHHTKNATYIALEKCVSGFLDFVFVLQLLVIFKLKNIHECRNESYDFDFNILF